MFLEESLKDWLMFENDLLIGVPTYTKELRKKIKLIDDKYTVFLCDVVISESYRKITVKNKTEISRNIPSMKCAAFEEVTIFSILVLQKLSDETRLEILNKLCDLLHHKIISCQSITFESAKETPDKTSVVQSKVTAENDDYDVTSVWWPVSCSSDSLDSGALHLVKNLVENGSLSRLLGVEIAGWKIINRGDVKARRAAYSLQTYLSSKSSQ